MKKTIFILLSILLLNSCSKTDESYLKATMLGNNIVKLSTKIDNKYSKSKNEMEIWFFNTDSIAYFYKYNFTSNYGAYYYADLRVKYKSFKLVEKTIGTISINNGIVNGLSVTQTTNGSIELKNYQL
jgi:PBP1b-binding outer membrane lipoprotein LpoB